jgi:hypothetical protein
MKYTINTRQDLDAIQGTKQHNEFMQFLKGTMTRKQNVAVYPDNYDEPDYVGETIEPIWEDVEDLSTINRFGFNKSDFDGV